MRGGTFGLLFRHFLGRFFRSEHAGYEAALRERASGAVAVAAVVGPFLFFLLLHLYIFLSIDPELAISRAWIFGAFFFGLAMVASGFVAVLAWDEIFPDEVDQAALSALPLRRSTLMGAKAAAVVALAGLEALVLTGTTSLVFALQLLPKGAGAVVFLRLILGYLTGGFLACASTFLACAALRGATLLLPNWRGVRRAQGWLHSALILGLAVGFALLPTTLSRMFALKEAGSAALYWIPSAWFIGLTQTLAGRGDPVFHRLAATGLGAAGAAVVLFLFFLSLGFRRFGRMREDRGGGASRGSLARGISRALDVFPLRSPQRRAAFWFFTLTLWRSAPQRLRLVTFLGVAAGWVFILQTGGFASLLSAAPATAFLAVAGAWSAAGIACQERAAWILRMTETPSKREHESGVRWGVWLGVLAPVFAVLGGVLALVGGVPHLGFHLVYHLLAAALLCEALVVGGARPPFASRPGAGRMTVPFLFVLGLYAYVSLLSAVEVFLLTDLPGRVAACAAEAVALAVVIGLRSRRGPYDFEFVPAGELFAFFLGQRDGED